MPDDEKTVEEAPAPAANTETDSKLVHSPSSSTTKHYWQHFRQGVLFALCLTIIGCFLEETFVYKSSHQIGYSWLQSVLIRLSAHQEVPVVVLDIDDLPMEHQVIDSKSVPFVARKPLQGLVESLVEASEDVERPFAIGLDIDMSPDEKGLVHGDTDFFDTCNRIRSKYNIPVYVGVDRRKADSPAQWLGSSEYIPLATLIAVPHEARTYMFSWLEVQPASKETSHQNSSPKEEPLASLRLPALSYALSTAYRPHPDPPHLFQWLLQTFSTQDLTEGVNAQSFLIDYSNIDRIQTLHLSPPTGRLAAYELNENQREQLAGKIVLLGSVAHPDPTDLFELSGRSHKVPGVYIHASATASLATEPLYEFKRWFRLISDFLLAVLGLYGYTQTRIASHRRNRKLKEIAVAYMFGAIALLTLVAALFLLFAHIFWPDFLVVAIVLLLHFPLEEGLKRVKQPLTQAFHKLEEEPDAGDPSSTTSGEKHL